MTGDASALESYQRYRAGDESALGDVIRAYSDGMTFFTSTLVKNPDDAEEIVSDAFVEIALKIRAFRGESALRTYLYAICRHKAIDLIRKRVRRGEIVSLSDDQTADLDTLEGRVLRTERDGAIHRAMTELCEEYRVALYLVYFEDMSHDDVARAMKKSRKQTENVIFRARRALRALLEKEGFTHEEL